MINEIINLTNVKAVAEADNRDGVTVLEGEIDPVTGLGTIVVEGQGRIRGRFTTSFLAAMVYLGNVRKLVADYFISRSFS